MCCLPACRSRWINDYSETLEAVEEDIKCSLDILDFLRRLRMHGFGIAALYSKEERKFIESRSEKKPIADLERFDQLQA